MSANLGIETISVHAEIERRIPEADNPRLHGATAELGV